MTDPQELEQQNFDLNMADEYELAAVAELSRLEGERSDRAEYVLCSTEELQALVSEVRRLQKEVVYLREALHFEERQPVRFRREHDCY